MHIVNELDQIKPDKDMATAVLLVAGSLYVMSMALKKIGKMDFTDAVQGFVGISLIMVAMGAFVKFLSDYDISGIAVGLIALAAAVNLLVIPITILGLLPFGTLMKGVVAIIAVVGALSAMAIWLSNSFGAIEAMNALTTAMIGISVPLMLLGLMAPKAALGLAVMIGALAGLAAAAYFAQFTGNGLLMLTTSMTGMSISAVIFSAAAYLIALAVKALVEALKTLVETFPLVVDAIVAFGTALREHGLEIALAVGAVLLAIVGGIAIAKTGIANAIFDLILTIGHTIVNNLPLLLGTIAAGILILFGFLRAVAPTLVDGLINLVVTILNALANGIRNNAPIILGAVANIIDAVLDLILEGIASLFDSMHLGGIGDKIRDAKDLWEPAAAELGETTANAIKDGAKVDGLGEEVDSNVRDELSTVDVTDSGFDIASQIGTGVDKGMNNWFEDWSVPDTMKNQLSDMYGGTIDTSILGGNDNAEGWGTGWTDWFDTGGTDKISGATTNAVDVAADAGEKEAAKRGPKTGEDYSLGAASGTTSAKALAALDNAGVTAANTLDKAFRRTSEIKSPSRKAARLGRFWDLGLAKGLLDNRVVINDAGEKTANTVIDSMRTVVGRIGEALNSDMDLNPTITPVLDLSEIQNGTGILNGMFGNTSLSLASGNGVRFEAARLEALNRLETESTNADVVAELGLLRGDISDLNDSFSNTQVVLDSGALVGATAKKMDNALGRFKTYKGRGI